MVSKLLTEDVHIRIEGRAGRITLNKPKALNALDHEMVIAIKAALDAWADYTAVALVIVDGAGDRAFCAGADLKRMHASAAGGDYSAGHAFFRDEYAMNQTIADFPKPYVAMMDGIVMGGGAGLSVHGSHRIVTERTLFAMPECGIGLVPDVGVSRFLASAPGFIGEYVGLTGLRLTGGEAIQAGFAGLYVPSGKLPALIDALCSTGEVASVYDFESEPDVTLFSVHQTAIDRCFSKESVSAIVAALEAEDSDFGRDTAALISKGSPLSLAATLDILRTVRKEPTVERALAEELKFTHRAQEFGDFQEGIRAVVIDKDRNPRWPDTIESLDPERLARMRAELA